MSTDADSADVDAVMALWGCRWKRPVRELYRVGLVDAVGVAKPVQSLTPEDWKHVDRIRRDFARRVGQVYSPHMRCAGLEPLRCTVPVHSRVAGLAFRGAVMSGSLNPRDWLLQTPMCQNKEAREALRQKLYAPPKPPPRWSTTLSLGGR